MKTRREFFETNVKNPDLLGRFFTNYRVPHTDADGVPLVVGDDVECTWTGSWIDGKPGIVMKLGVVGSDTVEGHLLQMDDGLTVAPFESVKKIS